MKDSINIFLRYVIINIKIEKNCFFEIKASKKRNDENYFNYY